MLLNTDFFLKLFFIIINSNIYITLTMRTNNTYNTLQTTKEKKGLQLHSRL